MSTQEVMITRCIYTWPGPDEMVTTDGFERNPLVHHGLIEIHEDSFIEWDLPDPKESEDQVQEIHEALRVVLRPRVDTCVMCDYRGFGDICEGHKKDLRAREVTM